jgi:hypothetical protein
VRSKISLRVKIKIVVMRLHIPLCYSNKKEGYLSNTAMQLEIRESAKIKPLSGCVEIRIRYICTSVSIKYAR